VLDRLSAAVILPQLAPSQWTLLRSAAASAMASDAPGELLQTLCNANLRLRDLQLLKSCSEEVLGASELVSIELMKALSLLARAQAPLRPVSPRLEPAPRPEPAPAVAAPVYLPPRSPSPPPLPPPAPDKPAVAPQPPPLDVAVGASTGQLPACADDFLPPYLVNKMRQQQNAAGFGRKLASEDFPSLGGGPVASSAAAGAWGRGRPPTLVAPQQAWSRRLALRPCLCLTPSTCAGTAL